TSFVNVVARNRVGMQINWFCKEIGNTIMKAWTLRICRENGIEELYNLQHAQTKTCLFPRLPYRCLTCRLPKFNRSTRKAPAAFLRRLCPTNQQHFIPSECNDGCRCNRSISLP